MMNRNNITYLSKEEFYKRCHISKATALRLLQSGLVPAIDTHKPTNRYLISSRDVEHYLRDREEHPERYKNSKHSKLQTYRPAKKYTKKLAREIRGIAQLEWAGEADVLQVSDVARLLGYCKGTIYQWKKRGWLKTLNANNTIYVPIECLLDFVETPEFYAMQQMSDQHVALLRRAIYEGS